MALYQSSLLSRISCAPPVPRTFRLLGFAFFREKVRIGAIQAINSHIEDRSSTHEKKEWKKDNYVSIPSEGDEVFVRYFGIWTEKIYLQYETCKSDFMDGFFAYFQVRGLSFP